LGAHFVGVGVGVLLEPCDSSDDNDGDDRASDVCIRFSVTSNMKSKNDFLGIRIILLKGNITIEKATLEKIEKYFLRPLDSFTNKWVLSQILVRCINTLHMSFVICDAFRFLLCHTRSSTCCFDYFSCMECSSFFSQQCLNLYGFCTNDLRLFQLHYCH